MKARLGELQYQMYADGRFGLLVVLQAIDGGGKDSTIRHVCSAFNPQGCTVTAFKAPSAEELHARLPVARAPASAGAGRDRHLQPLALRGRAGGACRLAGARSRCGSKRYEEINRFEQQLVHADIGVVKIFLHISRDEQKLRFQERLDDPRKHWKFDPTDLKKREQWAAVPARLRGRVPPLQHRARAVVRGAGESQVAAGPGGGADPAGCARGAAAEVAEAEVRSEKDQNRVRARRRGAAPVGFRWRA